MADDAACCAPGLGDAIGEPRGASSQPAGTSSSRSAPTTDRDASPNEHALVALDGGTFTMGSDAGLDYPGDGEGPTRRVTVSPFRIDRYAVSNAQFARFVDATGHVTEGERFGWSFVFAGLLPDDFVETRGVVGAEWWRQVYGADWRHPEGPHSDIEHRLDHPVLHVSWNDALAYCAWVGMRLPTEAEWEFAARGGLEGCQYPWGDDLLVDGRHRCNIWQGTFPRENTCDDGWYGTAPVSAFDANGFGLHNVVGNVWEWCRDWFDATHHQTGARHDPTGPPDGTHKVMRGGSFLCHESYCFRYRVPSRSSNTPDSSTGNLGFRCAADA
jgi:formylglycine-generating enzyme required for sulfatase activity